MHVSCHCSVSPAILSCCSHRPERCQSLQHSMLHRFCGCHCCLHSSICTSTCPASAGLSWPSPANRLTYFYVVSSSTSILSPPSPVLVCSFSIRVLLPGSCNCARHPLHPGVYPNNTISLCLTRSGNKSTGLAFGLLKGAILTKCEEIFNSVPDGGPFTRISFFCVPSCVLWQPREYRVLHNAVCCRVVLWTVFRLHFRSSRREISAPL